MSAATASVNTPQRPGEVVEAVPIEANTSVYVGTLGAINAAGNAVPAADAAGLRVMGRCEGTVGPGITGLDAVNNPGAAGAVQANFRRGTFLFNNSVADPVVAADLGKVVFVEDDNTVNHTGGTNHIKAGVFLGFGNAGTDSTRCIIDTRNSITG